MTLDYYLALLQLHIAVVGVAIAGVVALVQILNNAKPHRDFRLLVRPTTLIAYGLLLGGLLVLLAAGSWVSAFPAQAFNIFGHWIIRFFNNGIVGLATISMMLVSIVWFLQLAFKTRDLLDTQKYLHAYVRKTPPAHIHRYLAAIYADEPTKASMKAPMPYDPFQPIREYIKDNAFKYYDYGTADGLRQFGVLFDKALASSRRRENEEECVRLARFIGSSSEEFFRIFMKTASEKRKLDTIALLSGKGMALLGGMHDKEHDSFLYIIRDLEGIAKLSDDDDEIIAVINHIRLLCDTFLDGHKTHSWAHIDDVFDEICLSVTRISEDYYLQKNNSLKTVPIVAYRTGTHHTVTTALVDFFRAYSDLGDRHTDTLPLLYFEAIEGVIEVLFLRLGDIVKDGQQDIGYTATYHELARDLYKVYGAFGEDALEHGKPELLALVLSNLRRIIKPAKNYHLVGEHQELCNLLVKLAAGGVDAFGDIPIKTDGRTISEYTIESLSKHASKKDIAEALKGLDDFPIIPHPTDVARFVKKIKASA